MGAGDPGTMCAARVEFCHVAEIPDGACIPWIGTRAAPRTRMTTCHALLIAALSFTAVACASEYEGDRSERRSGAPAQPSGGTTATTPPATKGNEAPATAPAAPAAPTAAAPTATNPTTPPSAKQPPTADDVIDKAYDIALGRAPDAPGRAFWLDALASGTPKIDVLRGVVGSAEFAQLHAARTNEEYVQQLYLRLLRRAPASAEIAFWKDQLDQNLATRAGVAIAFVDSDEFASATNPNFAVFF